MNKPPARPSGSAPALDIATLTASHVHDLKNLLALLIATLDQTLATHLPAPTPEAESYLASLKLQAALINDKLVALLGFYRLTHGGLQPNPQFQVVDEFIEDREIETRPLLASRALTLQLEVEPELTWSFDRELVAIALGDALHNAIKYAQRTITLRAAAEGGLLVFSVIDDGPGYPADRLSAASPDLPAAPGPSDPELGGTGLGLYFARVVAAAHRHRNSTGRVELANAPGGGAVFRLLLP